MSSRLLGLCAARGIEAHQVHEHGTRQRDSRWRFASLTDAEMFARQFGGSLVEAR
jgi:hypothetical protein